MLNTCSRTVYIEILRALQFRANTLAGVVGTFVLLIVYLSLWRGIQGGDGDIDADSIRGIERHIALSIALFAFFDVDQDLIYNRVTSGSISLDLLRPVSFPFYFLYLNLGRALFLFVVRSLPILVITLFFLDLGSSVGPSNLLWVICATFLGYVIYFCLYFMALVSCFWYQKTFAIETLLGVAIKAFSGVFVPYGFYPPSLIAMIKATPIYYLFFPAVHFLSCSDACDNKVEIIIGQLSWAVVLVLLSCLVWRLAIKRLTVSGG